ncbi:phage tail protein [Flavobacterium suzhouense]|uniref:Phage tail protein n=1 Tax=Flavobacterium suzhouense TaxID=1529638 RepID=A0ABW5NYK7_9FLAO
MEEFIGIVKLFAGNFAPRGWALCNGQLLSISQNTALFSILGTTYGGDGQSTFALPNLQGNTAIGAGTSRLGTTYVPGQVAGTPTVTLNTSQIPSHNHTGQIFVSNTNSNTGTPTAGTVLGIPGTTQGRDFVASLGYTTATPNVNIANSVTVGPTGGNQPFSIMQPYLAMNYIICLEGIFPSRN